MSTGLAKNVKRFFGGKETLFPYPKPYVGGIGVTMERGKTVIHLVTKKLYYHKPTFKDLESSMLRLFGYCRELNITEISMPYNISCGLDRLHWPHVYTLITDIFENTDITVYICQYPF